MILVVERNPLRIQHLNMVVATSGSRPTKVRAQGLPRVVEKEFTHVSHLGRQHETTDGGLTVSTVAAIPLEQLARQDERTRILAALALRGNPADPPIGAWRGKIGMFADDPLMDRIFDAGRRIRESERDD